jgi:uncharacterized protein (TIGR02594 family)
MGKAKRAYLAIVFLLIFGSTSFIPGYRQEAVANPLFSIESSRGLATLRIAQGEIGNGEQSGNNMGRYIQRYNGRQGLPWCAGFISYCVKQAGVKLPYTLRAKDYARYEHSISKKEASSGGIVIFNRIGGGHIGIMESISKEGFISIEGNVGKFPAKVKRVKHRWSEKSIYKFVRI